MTVVCFCGHVFDELSQSETTHPHNCTAELMANDVENCIQYITVCKMA